MTPEIGAPAGAAEWESPKKKESLLKSEQIGEDKDGNPIYNQGYDVKDSRNFTNVDATPEPQSPAAEQQTPEEGEPESSESPVSNNLVEAGEISPEKIKATLEELTTAIKEAESNPGLWSTVKALAKLLGQLIFGLLDLGERQDDPKLTEIVQQAQSEIQNAEQRAGEEAKQLAAERMARLDPIRKRYQDKFDFYRSNESITTNLQPSELDAIGQTMNGLTEVMFQVGDINEKNTRLKNEIVDQKQSLAMETNPQLAQETNAKITQLEQMVAANEQAQQSWNNILDQELNKWRETMRHLDELASRSTDNVDKLKSLISRISEQAPPDQFDGKMGAAIEETIKQEGEANIINNVAPGAPEGPTAPTPEPASPIINQAASESAEQPIAEVKSPDSQEGQLIGQAA